MYLCSTLGGEGTFSSLFFVVYNSNDLQDKSDRYYFIDAMKVGYDEVYITKMDLNIEYGEIENVGTKENPIYVPMIRFSAPVFNKNLEKEGVIMLNVYADNLMTEIDNAAPKDNIFLVNNFKTYFFSLDQTFPSTSLNSNIPISLIKVASETL